VTFRQDDVTDYGDTAN